MGRLPSNNREYQIEHFWEHHQEICRLAATGMRRQDIAEAVGVSTATVTYTLNSDLGRNKVQALRKVRDERATDIASRIKKMAPKALDVLNEYLEDTETSEVTKRTVAFDILDRAGFKPANRNENVNIHLTEDELSEMKARRDAAREQGNIADTEEISFEEMSSSDKTEGDD